MGQIDELAIQDVKTPSAKTDFPITDVLIFTPDLKLQEKIFGMHGTPESIPNHSIAMSQELNLKYPEMTEKLFRSTRPPIY